MTLETRPGVVARGLVVLVGLREHGCMLRFTHDRGPGAQPPHGQNTNRTAMGCHSALCFEHTGVRTRITEVRLKMCDEARGRH